MGSDELVQLTLKPREEDRLLGGYLWVFSNELKEIPKDAAPGALAVIHGAKGRPLGMGFFNPKSLISFRLLSRQPAPVDAAFFKDRLAACLDRRRAHLGTAGSFRLAFGESDGLPGLVVDKYEDTLVVQALSAGIDARIDVVRDALVELLSPRAIVMRGDHPSRRLEGLGTEDRVLHGEVPAEIVISEGGIKYRVDPRGGQKTGFYFDQRDNRAAMIPYFKDKVVLDFYSYSGAFGLTAAKHGAAKVYGLDSSEAAVKLAEANAKLNGVSDVCVYDKGDAAEVLASFSDARRELRPDIVMIDPPSLAPAKKDLGRALRALERLNANAFRCLSGSGLVATSTCSHHITRQGFLDMLRKAAAKAQKTVRLVELRGQAKDHPVLLSMPETEYLHFALLEIS